MARDSKLINIAFDLICFILVLIDFIVTKTLLYGTTEKLYPVRQGFFCEDTSIRLPFQESYLSYPIVDSLSFVIPILVVSISSINSI